MTRERFTVEYARANAQLSIPQAASAATQLATAVDLQRYETFDAIYALARRLQLRSAFEWETYGYEPTEDAVPVRLESERNPLEWDTFYLAEHTSRPFHSHERLQPFEEIERDARKLVTGGEADYSALFPELPTRRQQIMGNLWRLGVVAVPDQQVVDAPSRTVAGTRALAGEQPTPDMTEYTAWWVIGVNPKLGKDMLPEIVRAAAATLIEDHPARGAESEAAAYLALERLWIPPRRGRTAWWRSYAAGEAMPAGFDWTRVYENAQRVENALRGI